MFKCACQLFNLALFEFALIFYTVVLMEFSIWEINFVFASFSSHAKICEKWKKYTFAKMIFP